MRTIVLTHALEASSAYLAFRNLGLSLGFLDHLCAFLHVAFRRGLTDNILQIFIIIIAHPKSLALGPRYSLFLLAGQGSKDIGFLIIIRRDFRERVLLFVCWIRSRAFWHPGGIF